MQTKLLMLLLTPICVASTASADELVTNGNFETQDENGVYGAGWNVAANFDYGNDRSFFFGQWGDSPDGAVTGASAYLTNDNDEDVAISQSIDTTGITHAYLSFDLFSSGSDFTRPGAPYDFLRVKFGSMVVDTIDLGSEDGMTPFDLHPTYDLSSMLRGRAVKTLTLEAVTDDLFPSYSFVDNVSLTTTPAPEPATLGAIALGFVGLLRRRENR